MKSTYVVQGPTTDLVRFSTQNLDLHSFAHSLQGFPSFKQLLLLLLLSHFSRVWLCATPQTAAHQAPPSLGFSRQEHCSGLPFPSPMYESEKWKVKVKSLSCVWLLETPWTAAYQAPLSMGFSRQEYWSGVPLPSPSKLSYFSLKQIFFFLLLLLFPKCAYIWLSVKQISS